MPNYYNFIKKWKSNHINKRGTFLKKANAFQDQYSVGSSLVCECNCIKIIITNVHDYFNNLTKLVITLLKILMHKDVHQTSFYKINATWDKSNFLFLFFFFYKVNKLKKTVIKKKLASPPFMLNCWLFYSKLITFSQVT